MTLPKIKTVNVVTMKHGREFAEGWFRVSIDDSCDDTGILTWPGDDEDDPSDDATEGFHELTNDICQRVFDALKEQIAETFVRVANAVIEEERTRPEEPLNPPRVEMVETVTPEHGAMFAEVVTREHGEVFADEWLAQSWDTGVITEACAEAGIVEWHSEPSNDVLTYYASIENEIAQRVSDQLRSAAVETFVRLANEVLTRERRERVTP